jgi:long-chain fatty acid transport protein
MKYALFLLPALCSAQGFDWNTVSARSLAMGGVYLPSSMGVLDALAANPAGLTALGAPTVDASVSGVFLRGDFRNSANPLSKMRSSAELVPFAAFGMPLGRSRFSVGAGALPELLSVSDWRYIDAPGEAGGASYGLQRHRSAILAVNTRFGVGYAVHRKVSLGAAAGLVYNSNRLAAPYIFQSHPALAGLKTLLDLKTSGTGWNGSVGALIRPIDRMQISVAWKTRTVIESTGIATGDLQAQLTALGLGGARSGFRYDAMVRNVLPQSALVGISMKMHRKWLAGVQSNWTGWRNSFASLPVTLTNGTNGDINALLSSNAIFDRVPLHWKDQITARAGVEFQASEAILLRGGYALSNSPVPSSTLSPLTAAILRRQVSAGFGYRIARWRFDAAYGFTPLATQTTQATALRGGEYAGSRVRIGLQSLTLTTAYRF